MSNNKQIMKLYTERQMKEMFRMGLAHSINENGALAQFAPIELPSDEELKKQFDVDEFDPYDLAYLGGAIWMRDKIQGGNNETIHTGTND